MFVKREKKEPLNQPEEDETAFFLFICSTPHTHTKNESTRNALLFTFLLFHRIRTIVVVIVVVVDGEKIVLRLSQAKVLRPAEFEAAPYIEPEASLEESRKGQSKGDEANARTKSEN